MLASWLYDHANCFSAVYTQRAISDVWLDNQVLDYSYTQPMSEHSYGVLTGTDTKVYQMHKHVPTLSPVRTREALRCALDRVGETFQGYIVLVAHDKQFWRAFRDLIAMYPEHSVINPSIADVPYPNSESAYTWAIRELYIAKPMEFLQRQLTVPMCRQEVALDKTN